jgi:two-component system sensor kinase
MNIQQTIDNRSLDIPLRRRLRTRLTAYFVLLTIGAIVIVTTFTLIQVRNQAIQQTFHQLESIAQLKQNQITRWVEESKRTLNLILADPDVRQEMTALASEPDTMYESSLNALLRYSVEAQTEGEPIFSEIIFYNRDGRVLGGSNPASINKVVTLQPYFEHSLQGTYVTPPYYEIVTSELTMFVTHPIKNATGEIIGAAGGRLNIDVLRDVTGERAGLGDTGETYLVSTENNYLLTPSRFAGYSMQRAYRSQGIDSVLRGEDGSGMYANYADTPVLGVYRWLPDLEAGLLTEMSEAEAQVIITQTSTVIIGLVVVLGVIAGGLGFYAATNISRPIARLSQVAAQVAGGNLQERADIHEDNEIGLLASTFNQMTSQLVNSIQELDKRVDELNQTNDALRVATAKAKEAARVKGEFLANISHELRTPLNAIIGFSDMLLMGMSGELNPKQRHKMERLRENGTRLLTLINNVLDITRIEARRIEINARPFSPQTLAGRLSDQMIVLAEQKKLALQTRVDPDLPETLIGDEQRIEQVVVNLLSNAFKFTDEGAVTLELLANRDENTWEICVSDTGIGIPPHALSIIFEEFRQVDGSSARAYKGSGLGLAITRNLVRMMDGQISVESEMGQGSKFTVVFPLVTNETVELEKVSA